MPTLPPDPRFERVALVSPSSRFAPTECRDTPSVASWIERHLASRLGPESGLRLDYARVLDARTLEPLEGDRIDRAPEGAVAAVAAFAGTTRLIDNVWLKRAEDP